MTQSTLEAAPAWQRMVSRAAARRVAAGSGAALEPDTSGIADTTVAQRQTVNEPDGAPDVCGIESLYEPLLTARAPFALAHLGQSIDGCIATASGHSLFVTGEANLQHLHRLRALSDAILVGAGTVAADDPQLTVRRVPGTSPVRVVLDRHATLAGTFGLFSGQGPDTLVVTANGNDRHAGVSSEHLLHVPEVDGRLDPFAVRDALSLRGLSVLFLEGGGVTVSQWLLAGALDRLHIAIAPVLIGAGRRGIALPSAADMPSALRPPATLHRMGEDVLWDLDLATCAPEH